MQKEDNRLVWIVGAVVAVVAIIVLLALASQNNAPVEEPGDVDRVVTDPIGSIVETAQDNAELTTLVDAVVAADLTDVLADPNQEYTVFAPTNVAFAEIQDTVDQLLLPENIEQLTDVLTYHVIEGEVLAADIVDGATVTTLQGSELTLRVVDGEVYVNGAEVLTANVVADNGVVHVVDQVLVPGEFGTVTATAASNDDLSTLVTAVTEAGLADALADPDAEYTVFAPTNAAFADIQETVDQLLAAEDKTDLANILQYHVVDMEYFAGELRDGQQLVTLTGETLEVEITSDGVFIVGENSRAEVLIADVLTQNGIVHVVDTVILP